MIKLFTPFFQKIVPAFGILILSTLTLGTSVMGASKVIEGFKTEKPNAVELAEKKDSGENNSVPAANKNLPSQNTEVDKTNSSGALNSSGKGTGRNSNQNINVPNNTVVTDSTKTSTNVQTGCLVTLFGKRYDVTPLKTTHPGGDIFSCGTDMTTVYQSQHGTDVSRMQAYLVNETSPGTGNMNSAGNGGGQVNNPASGNSTSKIGKEDNEGNREIKDDKNREVDDDREVENEEDD